MPLFIRFIFLQLDFLLVILSLMFPNPELPTGYMEVVEDFGSVWIQRSTTWRNKTVPPRLFEWCKAAG